MENLQNMYSKSNVTLSELAKLTGFSVSTISRYVNGTVKFPNKMYSESIEKVLIKLHPELNTDVNEQDSIGTNITNKIAVSDDLEQSNDKVITVDVNELKQQMYNNTFNGSNTKYTGSNITATATANKLYDTQSSVNNEASSIQQSMANSTSNNNTYARIPHRGDIYYIKNNYSTGQEQYGNRPGLILSNDKFNNSMGTVNVVYLTSQPRMPLPCHVSVKTSKESIVLCEQIFTVSKERLLNYMGHITDSEMSMVNKGVMMGLGLTYNQVNMTDSHDYQRLQVENRMLKEFNETLLGIAMK